jgi:hypothetical protein
MENEFTNRVAILYKNGLNRPQNLQLISFRKKFSADEIKTLNQKLKSI